MNANMKISSLESQIALADINYRIGSPIISDAQYDALTLELKALSPNSPLLHRLVGEKFLGEKIPLPFPMGSLRNITNVDELDKFLSPSTSYVITPKLDGISATRFPNKTYVSRGDGGTEGTDISAYCRYFDKSTYNGYQRGEIVISKSNLELLNEYRISESLDPYKSPRSAVVGLMQSEKPDIRALSLLEFIPYTVQGGSIDKNSQLELLAEHNHGTNIRYTVMIGGVISVDVMNAIYAEWSKEYEIDGLVIDVQSVIIREQLGYHTNSLDPRYAMAYKINLEEQKDTVVLDVIRQIGKTGAYTPVLIIKPVVLCGTTVSKINVDNERFILWNGIGVGTNITLKKSGNVIPRLTHIEGDPIMSFKDFDKVTKMLGMENIKTYQKDNGIINMYKEPDFPYDWDSSLVNIIVSADDHEGIEARELKQIEGFFSELGVMDIGASTVRILYEHGYNSIPAIVNATYEQLLQVPTFGKKKAENLSAEIDKRLNLAKLPTIMHASGIFPKVGSTRLASIGFDTKENKRFTYEQIRSVAGIGDVMAQVIFDGQDKFWKLYNKISRNILELDESDMGKKPMDGEIICFTGFRDKKLADKIVEYGGEYKESINKSVTLVVYDRSAESSTKVTKAKKSGIKTIEKSFFYDRMTTYDGAEKIKKDVSESKSLF